MAWVFSHCTSHLPLNPTYQQLRSLCGAELPPGAAAQPPPGPPRHLAASPVYEMTVPEDKIKAFFKIVVLQERTERVLL